jgi:hypothetical protein
LFAHDSIAVRTNVVVLTFFPCTSTGRLRPECTKTRGRTGVVSLMFSFSATLSFHLKPYVSRPPTSKSFT